ncbi:MAG: rhomboid family intramembrane serine protease [Actinotalea sp.]|nr:rhomboid family intramembrane serine protease [Actinotalea sp.]
MSTPGPPQPGQPATGPEAVPVCPRHPDRVSYVRCQRCGRPACPQCQRQAAVGVHCVDCVRESARTAPVARTAFGAPLRQGRPVVTLTLIGLCVVSFGLQLGIAGIGGTAWTHAWIFSPLAGAFEPWRFVTAGFLHSTSMVLHIAFNMYALWLLGPLLEQALGRGRFLALYLLSVLGGTVMFTLLATTPDAFRTGVVGASGAVFGLFGALLPVLRRLRRDARGIIVLVAINGVLGFVVPGIAWEAHLGGFLVGLVLGAAFAYAPRRLRAAVAVVVPLLVLLLLVGAVSLKYLAALGTVPYL